MPGSRFGLEVISDITAKSQQLIILGTVHLVGIYDVISQYPEEAAKLMKIADDMRKDLGDNLTRVKGTGRREPGKLK